MFKREFTTSIDIIYANLDYSGSGRSCIFSTGHLLRLVQY